MTTFDARALYELLPQIVRLRDAEAGGPLRELLDVVADQAAVLEADLDRLYDDAFVETCAPWVLPYIGDLLGVTGLPKALDAYSPRAEVAHTIALRRRKGTAAALEQLARDITGWSSRAVEFFLIVAATQSMKRPRPEHAAFLSVRGADRLLDVDSAFEKGSPGGLDDICHRPDVRRIATGRGRHNLPHVGLFVFRIGAYPHTLVPARSLDNHRFTFHPLGAPVALYHRPRTERDVAQLAQPVHVPHPIRRRELRASLDADSDELYGEDASILVYRGSVSVPRAEVVSCDLSAWSMPDWPAGKHLAIDSALGRMVFKEPQSPGTVKTTYHYGACADLGGGEYERAATISAPDPAMHLVRIPTDAASLSGALTAIGASGKSHGVIEIEDSRTLTVDPMALTWPSLRRLSIRAANKARPTIYLTRTLNLPGTDAEIELNGLTLAGHGARFTGAFGKLMITHSTLVPGLEIDASGAPAFPGEPSLTVANEGARVEITKSILGGLRVHPDAQISIRGSVIDATHPTNIAFANIAGSAAGGSLTLDACTVVGKVWASALPLAQNSIFYAAASPTDTWAPVRVRRRQEGCVRFCYVPFGSFTPPRYKCEPEGTSVVAPAFTTRSYGQAAYAQLHNTCPPEIRRGADDESEMGVYNDLRHPLREAHLASRLTEYLRFGLEAGIIYAS